MTRHPTTPEQRKRRLEEIEEKRKADQIAEEKAIDESIQRNIEKHGP